MPTEESSDAPEPTTEPAAAPAVEALPPVPKPEFETIAVPLRTEPGASVRRTKLKDKPDVLNELFEELKAFQAVLINEGLEKQKEEKKPQKGLKEMQTLTVRYDKLPNRQVRIGHMVNTYAVIREEKDKLVVRCYAHIPALFNNAIVGLIKSTGRSVEFSKDSFIRPSGI